MKRRAKLFELSSLTTFVRLKCDETLDFSIRSSKLCVLFTIHQILILLQFVFRSVLSVLGPNEVKNWIFQMSNRFQSILNCFHHFSYFFHFGVDQIHLSSVLKLFLAMTKYQLARRLTEWKIGKAKFNEILFITFRLCNGTCLASCYQWAMLSKMVFPWTRVDMDDFN